MLTPAEHVFFGSMSFALVVAGVTAALLWWRTFVNPSFPSRGLPQRVDDQELRIAKLEMRVATQEEQLEGLRQRVVELNDRLAGLNRRET